MKPKERVFLIVKALPRARREALRAEAWTAFQKGEGPSSVARRLRIRVRLAFSWKKQLPSTSEAIPSAATEARRGPPPATGSALTAQQFRKLDRTVADQDPAQLKFPFALWSSKAVVRYLQRTFGVTICRRTARRYLRKLGYTYQCPARQARGQDLVDVTTWKTVTYPGIRLMAHAAGGVVLWGDEATVQTRTAKTRGCGKRGQPPLLRGPSSYGLRTNYIPAVGNRGDFQFMTFKESMNVAALQEFLRRLMHDEPRPIYLILDNLRVHHATLIRNWLAEEEVARHLKLFFLPARLLAGTQSGRTRPPDGQSAGGGGGVAGERPCTAGPSPGHSRGPETLAGDTRPPLRPSSRQLCRPRDVIIHGRDNNLH